MLNVLLLNSDKSAVVSRLTARPETSLHVIAAQSYAEFYRGLPGVSLVPAIDDLTAVRAAALDVARSLPLHRVVAATEKSIVPAAFVRRLLGLPGISVDQALAFTHKHAMKEVLRTAGLPVARSRVVAHADGLADAAAEVGAPFVVKPVTGALGRSTFRVGATAELKELARHLGDGPYQVEEFVPVIAEYHCDGVVRDGTTVFTSVSRYFEPLLSVGTTNIGGSYVLDQNLPEVKEIADLHERAIVAIGCANGVTHLECLRTGTGTVIGEITCRPGGGAVPETVHAVTGIDLWTELVRAELGDPPGTPAPPPDGVFGWTYLRTDAASAQRAARSAGVTDVVAPGADGGSHILSLRTEDEAGMLALHAEISREVRLP